MASPVIINSSSPNSLRLPTVTPPSRRNSIANAGTTSSPGLPSPSTFVKPKVPALKSGSRAQAIPASAGFGFATAGSLWRESKIQNDAIQNAYLQETTVEPVVKNSRVKEREDAQQQTSGKLKKPAKAARKQTESAKKNTSSMLHLEDFACHDNAPRTKDKSEMACPPKAAVQRPKAAVPSRKPSVDLSEFTFGVYDLGMQTQAPAALNAAKKPRKKAATSKALITKSNAVDKPRKRKAKSEAIILNSDDPVQEDKINAKHDARPVVESFPITVVAKKKNKASTARPAISFAREGDDVGVAPEKQRASQNHIPAVENSVHFIGAPTGGAVVANDGGVATSERAEQPAGTELVEDVAEDLAAPRRREWTPVKNTCSTNRDGPSLATSSPPISASPKPQLADILCGFGYADENTTRQSAGRTASGEAVTKRRRIELADGGPTRPAPLKAKANANKTPATAREPKKPVGRKKLQTITGLATAAYQAPAEQSGEQSTVSEFFAPRKDNSAIDLDSKEVASTTVEKPKKTRKPRKKKEDAVQCDKSTAKPKRTKKTRGESDETNFLTKLYSPSRATAQMKQQDFLFGTSSQLAVDESVTFVRDMQAAVQASEGDSRPQLETCRSQMQSSEILPSQHLTTPRKAKSCAKVPTAPHGTCLSLGQAQRDLWCVSSRDDDGGFLREPLKMSANLEQRPSVVDDGKHERAPTRQLSIGFEQTAEEAETQSVRQMDQPSPDQAVRAVHEKDSGSAITIRHDAEAVIDLCDTSPAVLVDTAEDSAIAFDEDEKSVKLPPADTLQPQPDRAGAIAQDFKQPRTDDGSHVISSDQPEPDAGREQPLDDDLPTFRLGSISSRSPTSRKHLLSPIKYRSVLQPVDVNASMHSLASLRGFSPIQARAVSSNGSPLKAGSTTGRPQGRPRNDSSTATSTATSPKKRGRPPKRPIVASDPSPEAAKFKRPKAAVSASLPLQSPSNFLDVDEISDSDSPVTPSPPRRRASSSPPAVSALDVAISGSPLVKLKENAPAVLSATSAFKLSDPQWPSIRERIFPQISTTVKDAPQGTDPSKPSWYQKILMYDPVTLEELTAWLNKQGLRVQVQKQKPKTKKRGRKKKAAAGEVVEEESAVEWEEYSLLSIEMPAGKRLATSGSARSPRLTRSKSRTTPAPENQASGGAAQSPQPSSRQEQLDGELLDEDEQGKVSIAEEAHEDDLCPICQLLLCKPVTTQCRHTMCKSCMATWADVSLAAPMTIVAVTEQPRDFDAATGLEANCPMCRTRTTATLDHDRTRALRSNYSRLYAEREAEEAQDEQDGESVQTLTVYIGNEHRNIDADPEGLAANKHEWTFFVRPSRTDIIEEIHTHLHPTFRQNHIIRSRPPYAVTRVGWGYFTITASVILKAGYTWVSSDAQDSPDGAEKGMLRLEWTLDFSSFESTGAMGRCRLKVKSARGREGEEWDRASDEGERDEAEWGRMRRTYERDGRYESPVE